MPIIVLILLLGLLVGTAVAWSVVRRATDGPNDAGWNLFLEELERARRYERPFAVARIPNAEAMPALHADDPTPVPAALHLRRTDEMWWMGCDLYALLPETDRSASDRWRERVLAKGSCRDIRIAGFPDDGLTTSVLLAALEGPSPLGSLEVSRAGHDEPSRSS